MVARLFALPCLRTKVTVSTVPVDGAQVILKGVPTGMDCGRETKLKGFCAAAKAVNSTIVRKVMNCILEVINILLICDVFDRATRMKKTIYR